MIPYLKKNGLHWLCQANAAVKVKLPLFVAKGRNMISDEKARALATIAARPHLGLFAHEEYQSK